MTRRQQQLHLSRASRRRRCQTTFPGPDGYVIPDLVDRRFEPGAPDSAWVQDITYIPTGEGWLYLASVLDLGSRRLVGYSMADHLRTELVLDALGMAVTARGGTVAGVIGHADRGSQYTSNDYLEFCHAHQILPSVGRTEVCWDAVAESFWESLKRECIQGRVFATRAEARRAIFRWVNLVQHDPTAHQPQQRPTDRVGTAAPSSVITTRPPYEEMADPALGSFGRSVVPAPRRRETGRPRAAQFAPPAVYIPGGGTTWCGRKRAGW